MTRIFLLISFLLLAACSGGEDIPTVSRPIATTDADSVASSAQISISGLAPFDYTLDPAPAVVQYIPPPDENSFGEYAVIIGSDADGLLLELRVPAQLTEGTAAFGEVTGVTLLDILETQAASPYVTRLDLTHRSTGTVYNRDDFTEIFNGRLLISEIGDDVFSGTITAEVTIQNEADDIFGIMQLSASLTRVPIEGR